MMKLSVPLPELSEYEVNRAAFTLEQLLPYDGQWVAFSHDGRRIVAAAPDLLELDQRVIAAGEDPEQVGIESVHLSGTWVGGAEFTG